MNPIDQFQVVDMGLASNDRRWFASIPLFEFPSKKEPEDATNHTGMYCETDFFTKDPNGDHNVLRKTLQCSDTVFEERLRNKEIRPVVQDLNDVENIFNSVLEGSSEISGNIVLRIYSVFLIHYYYIGARYVTLLGMNRISKLCLDKGADLISESDIKAVAEKGKSGKGFALLEEDISKRNGYDDSHILVIQQGLSTLADHSKKTLEERVVFFTDIFLNLGNSMPNGVVKIIAAYSYFNANPNPVASALSLEMPVPINTTAVKESRNSLEQPRTVVKVKRKIKPSATAGSTIGTNSNN